MNHRLLAKELILNILSQYTFEIKKDIVIFKNVGYDSLTSHPSNQKIKVNQNYYCVNPYREMNIKKQFEKFCEFFGHIMNRIRDLSNLYLNGFSKNPLISNNNSQLFDLKNYDKNEILECLKLIKTLYDDLCEEFIKL